MASRHRPLALVFITFAGLAASAPIAAADLITFWNIPRHGGNSFNRLPPDRAYFQALKGHGATWVRLSFDKWKPAQRDFLIGNADDYRTLDTDDLATLRATLDRAHAAGLKVVVAPLSLPWMRWSQNNGDRFDDRLWRDRKHWDTAARYWRDAATALRDHPAIAAYNIINEPAPEKLGGLPEHAPPAAMAAWFARERKGARNLPAFYARVIAAIREVDKTTPIMVDAGWYAAADAFDYWPAPLGDTRVLYAFHMYEPYAVTSAPNLKRRKPYAYPGVVPFGGKQLNFDAGRVKAYLKIPMDWAARHAIPANRLVAAEFGCVRQLAGCAGYLEDVIGTLDTNGVHWAFYSFREDTWDAMDYELGTGKVPWRYWQAVEAGTPDPVLRKATPLFDVIRKRL
ncbi:glycoside hydrolase family 5 protein [Pinirhizobacter sp.]|jgi:hypothetical protein|uniref:glycoside hydrolase family 5 protein n=1 Tax=Pinirhizobacter sp. TaxID=2950432 RepID=UPI002F3EED4B